MCICQHCKNCFSCLIGTFYYYMYTHTKLNRDNSRIDILYKSSRVLFYFDIDNIDVIFPIPLDKRRDFLDLKINFFIILKKYNCAINLSV